MFGRPEAAEAKRLLVVPAGPAALIGKCRPIFDAIGRQTFVAGDEPWHLFLDVMNALFGSPVYANYGRAIADGQFEPAGFALKLGLKDVRLAVETAEECASPMPFASVLRDQLLAALAAGQGEMDWASVAKIAARNAGLGGL